MRPTPDQISGAPKHIAWEYAAALAAALETTKAHRGPTNHHAQEVFLVHLRNLAEFFRNGVEEFKRDPSAPPPRSNDDIYAVDFCHSALWDAAPFDKNTKLIRAINKTLSHMTYSRDLKSEIDIAFDARYHIHGTVILLRRTWNKFVDSMRPEHKHELGRWLDRHTRPEDLYGLRVQIAGFDALFESQLSKLVPHWRREDTPDGPVR